MFTGKEKQNFILTTLASVLAANGLITNSVSGVIASMLVSPYLSVITKIASDLTTLTFVSHDFIVLGSYMGISLLVGITYYVIQKNILGINKIDIIRENSEMINRADLNIREFASIFIYAFIAGITIGFIKNNPFYSESGIMMVSVGIAIGVSLLPSMVNSGLYIIENNRGYAFNSMFNTVTTISGIILGIISHTKYTNA
jgi:hypothetical protein